MRQPKPFYKTSHKAWYLERNGKQECLIKGDKAATQEEAFREYHRRMAGELPTTNRTTVAEIVAQYLAWVEKNRSPATHEWYVKYLDYSPKSAKTRRTFLDYIGDRKLVADLKPVHIQRWLDDKFSVDTNGNPLSDNYKNCAARSVATCFNWAADLQILPGNPVRGFKRPAPQARECYLTPDQWQKLINAVDGPFADLLWFLHETGARPQEAKIVTAADFNKAGRRLVLTREKSKGKRLRRVIRLNDRAMEIVTRLALKHPDGELFRNNRGRAWTNFSLNCRFQKVRKKLGFPVFAYVLRHTFITDALLRGVDPLTVAALAGHKDAAMIMKVYSHLCENDEHLAAKLKQATGEDAA